MKLSESEYNKLRSIAFNICKTDLKEDLLHECIYIILSYPKDKMESIVLNGRLFFFAARVMSNLYHSKTSSFYYKYRKEMEEQLDDYDTNLDLFIFTNEDNALERIELIERLLENIYWYDRELFMLYYFGKNNGKKYTYTSLAEETGISRRSIFYTIANVREDLKSRIDEVERVSQV